MRDPYIVLGVQRSASADDIKRAYRRLAKELHPDLNPGRIDIEQRFKDVSVAYDLLSDTDLRRQYDRGEIEPDGSPKRPRYTPSSDEKVNFGFRNSAPRSGTQQAGGDDLFDQIFGIFGQRGGRSTWSPDEWGEEDAPSARPSPITIGGRVSFLTTIKGGTHRVRLPSGHEVDVYIPSGTEEGTRLRLPEKGIEAIDGRIGDAIVEVEIIPHPILCRQGANIISDLPIDLHQAVLGDRVEVQTIDGPVNMSVPKGSNSGTKLRLRGKGVPRADGTAAGDHYVTLLITLSDPNDEALAAFLRDHINQSAKAT
jgi:DnaJ-class molecular chaperone